MRIAVVGAGAMGGVFGARLADRHDVVMVDVAVPVVEAISLGGLSLTEADGVERPRASVAATNEPVAGEPVDLAIFFVKTYATDSAATLAAPLIGPETILLTLQNGLGGAELLAKRFAHSPVVTGVTYESASTTGAGKVVSTSAGRTLVGPSDDGDPGPARLVAEALAGVGMNATASEQIDYEIWSKLALNAAVNPIAALTRLTIGGMGAPGPARDLLDRVVRETIAVAAAVGVEIDADSRIEEIHQGLARGGDGKGSMLQDIEAARRTEVDAVTGAVVRLAHEHGVEVPVSEALIALIKGYEIAHALR